MIYVKKKILVCWALLPIYCNLRTYASREAPLDDDIEEFDAVTRCAQYVLGPSTDALFSLDTSSGLKLKANNNSKLTLGLSKKACLLGS